MHRKVKGFDKLSTSVLGKHIRLDVSSFSKIKQVVLQH